MVSELFRMEVEQRQLEYQEAPSKEGRGRKMRKGRGLAHSPQVIPVGMEGDPRCPTATPVYLWLPSYSPPNLPVLGNRTWP
jgi:hypothetical protein